MERLWRKFVSIHFYVVDLVMKIFFFGMSSKHHLNSKNIHSRWRCRDSELVFSFRVQHSLENLVWETAVLRTSGACMPA